MLKYYRLYSVRFCGRWRKESSRKPKESWRHENARNASALTIRRVTLHMSFLRMRERWELRRRFDWFDVKLCWFVEDVVCVEYMFWWLPFEPAMNRDHFRSNVMHRHAQILLDGLNWNLNGISYKIIYIYIHKIYTYKIYKQWPSGCDFQHEGPIKSWCSVS